MSRRRRGTTGLRPNATQRLADELDRRRSGRACRPTGDRPPDLCRSATTWSNAVVTVDSGKLTLQLVAPDGRWLVDGVDWDRP